MASVEELFCNLFCLMSRQHRDFPVLLSHLLTFSVIHVIKRIHNNLAIDNVSMCVSLKRRNVQRADLMTHKVYQVEMPKI